jgi:hypothetical protein
MYKIGTTGLSNEITFIFRVSDGTFIPEDLGNKDYQEYLVWVSEGNTAGSYP